MISEEGVAQKWSEIAAAAGGHTTTPPESVSQTDRQRESRRREPEQQQPEPRWESGRPQQRPHGHIPARIPAHTAAGSRQSTRARRRTGEVTGSRLLATTRKQAWCARKHTSPAHTGLNPELIGSVRLNLKDKKWQRITDLHDEDNLSCGQSTTRFWRYEVWVM